MTSPSTVRAAFDASGWGGEPVLIDPQSGDRMSREDLPRRASQLWGALVAAGVGPGDRVGYATSDSSEAAAWFMSCIYAGVPIIPLNVEAGRKHLSEVMDRAGIRAVITTASLHADVTSWIHDLERPPAIIDAAALAAASAAELPPVEPDDEAFVMYTSGSTGAPKGVRLSHANAFAQGLNNQIGYEWDSTDRVMCPLPFWHMNACDKSLGALVSGAAMIVPDRFRVAEFWDWTTAERPSTLIMVPTMLSELLQHTGDLDGELREALASIRYAGSSSAPLNAAVHDEFVERFGVPVIEAFGMSETGSIFVTSPPPTPSSPGSVGRPAGWETRVVDAAGVELADGEVGALELRGPALTVGYDDSEVFADALTDDGWFHTGDIGRFDADRHFFVVGRAKEIIIKGGVNIAPREIDEVVAHHPAVVEVATVGVPDHLLGQDIETFVVVRTGARIDDVIAEVSAACLEQLGILKTPRRIRAIDALPKGPGGKVQPLRLLDLIEPQQGPPSELRGEVIEDDQTAPASEFERIVHTQWTELLQNESLGVHQSFFDHGGYSLLALESCVKMRSELRLQVALATLFENPTVSSFTHMLVAQAWLSSKADDVPLRPPSNAVLQVADHVAAMASESRATLETALLIADRNVADQIPEAASILLTPPGKEHGASTAPLFCAYGPYQYARFAAHLADTTAVYGLYVGEEADLGESDGGDVGLPVTTLAEHYVAAMRMVQPEGPYHLAGFSFGGRVALEMAAQLKADGHEVALLAPIDTYLDTAKPIWHPLHLARTPTTLWRRWRRNRARARVDATQPARETSAFVDRVRDEQIRYRKGASAAHQLPSYDGEIDLIVATRVVGNRVARSQNRRLGWNRVTSRVTRHPIRGSHHELVRDPHAAQIADRLRSKLTVPEPAPHPTRTRVYLHPLIDSRRWELYVPRDDDIIITTSMKAGTTWMQRIVSVLVSGSTEPVDLDAMSPWVESRTDDPTDVMMERLEAQTHRRFLKSHLPSDALPHHPNVKYVVVGRDTRDVFMSMYHHYAGYAEEMLRTINATPGAMRLEPAPESAAALWPQWMGSGSYSWERDGSPFWSHHHHAASWWRWRRLPNIHLVHYHDLLSDPRGEIHRLAVFLDIEVDDDDLDAYVEATSFNTMKSQGSALVPQFAAALSGGTDAFFRSGTSQQWTDELSSTDLELYEQNAAATLGPELTAWLETGRHGADPDLA